MTPTTDPIVPGDVVAPRPTATRRPAVPRILLVEDDEGDAVLVEALLEEAFGDEAHILRARSLVEAVEIIDTRRPGAAWCALVDLGLPDAEDLDALTGIRAAAPYDPVVVLTGLADDEKGLAAVAAGAQDYLVKGRVTAEDLRRSIFYAVERCRADDAARQLIEERLQYEENVRLERGLLPTPLLERHEALDWAARYRPGSNRLRIGGDFYDLVERDGVVHLLVGDVCGHGPDEAAVGVVLRVAWRALVRAGLPPVLVMEHLNDLMAVEALQDGQFATMASVRLLGDGRVGVALAGHPAPFVMRGTDVAPLDAKAGPPLGLFAGRNWREESFELEPGSRLLAFTDGLVEGRADPGRPERLGVEGAVDLLRRLLAAGLSGAELLDALLVEVEHRHGGPLADDVALIDVAPPLVGDVADSRPASADPLGSTAPPQPAVVGLGARPDPVR